MKSSILILELNTGCLNGALGAGACRLTNSDLLWALPADIKENQYGRINGLTRNETMLEQDLHHVFREVKHIWSPNVVGTPLISLRPTIHHELFDKGVSYIGENPVEESAISPVVFIGPIVRHV